MVWTVGCENFSSHHHLHHLFRIQIHLGKTSDFLHGYSPELCNEFFKIRELQFAQHKWLDRIHDIKRAVNLHKEIATDIILDHFHLAAADILCAQLVNLAIDFFDNFIP